MFLQMGQLGPHPHFSTFGVMTAWGVAASWDCGSFFIGGLEVDVGGIGQSFLHSNMFPNIDPALGHGVPAQVGIFLSGGGLLPDELSWEGFPFSKFIVVLGAVVDVCVIVLLTLGVDLGLAITCTLYLLVGMSFLLLPVAFTSLLTRGVGIRLDWSGLILLGLNFRFWTQLPF